jgi:glutamate/tyrosine decarboxylase-like PLP-dependent enzyme
MHAPHFEDESVLADIGRWALARLAARDATLPAAAAPAGLPAVTEAGIGVAATWHWMRDALLPTAIPADHPRYLAFVGGAPTVAGVLADMAISASGVYAGSELEGGHVVAAEVAAVRWLADLVGYGPLAGGTFVSGGSLANLSALVAARHDRVSRGRRAGSVIVAAASAHSSVRSAAAIMGCEVVAAGHPDRPLTGAELVTSLDRVAAADVVAVVVSAGATNTGAVDRIDELAHECAKRGLWLHVDAAYGGAAMLSARVRDRFRGIEFADSVTIDPHKWLFTPFDCAAILYRDSAVAKAAHRQRAAYLDPVNDGAENPADYAVHLTRRARGIPFWASLVANGVESYRDAIEECLGTAAYAAKQVEAADHLELVGEPELSVVLLRCSGWTASDYRDWSKAALAAGVGLVTPTEVGGQAALRLCFVNPQTSTADIDLVLASLGEWSRN